MNPNLTERQGQVMTMLDQRIPIKVIAAELGISESRVNQHIRALKGLWGVNDLAELVAAFRGSAGATVPYRKSAYSIRQLQPPTETTHPGVGNEFFVAQSPLIEGSGLGPQQEGIGEPKIVPDMLDGGNAMVGRFAVMVGLSFALIAMVVLSIAAAQSVSDLLSNYRVFLEDGTAADVVDARQAK